MTFLDETIETLNQTITAQWQQIDALTRQLAILGERLREAEARAPRRQRTTAALLNIVERGREPRGVGVDDLAERRLDLVPKR